MTSHAGRRADGSNPVVGSSRKSELGVADQREGDVEPTPLPARELRARLPAFSSRPTSPIISSTRAGRGEPA